METLFQKIKIYLDIAGESFESPEYINNNLKHDFLVLVKRGNAIFPCFLYRGELYGVFFAPNVAQKTIYL